MKTPKSSKSISINHSLILGFRIVNSIEELNRCEERIQKTQKLFSSAGNIRPANCDQLVKAITGLLFSIDFMLHLPKSTIRRNMSIHFIGYSYLNGLYRTRRLAQQMKSMVVEFRSICFKKNSKTNKLQTQIDCKLIELTKVLQKVKKESTPILDHFQQQNLPQRN